MIMKKGYAADALLRDLGVRLPDDGNYICLHTHHTNTHLNMVAHVTHTAIDVDGRHLGGLRTVLLNHTEMRKQAYNTWLKVLHISESRMHRC